MLAQPDATMRLLELARYAGLPIRTMSTYGKHERMPHEPRT